MGLFEDGHLLCHLVLVKVSRDTIKSDCSLEINVSGHIKSKVKISVHYLVNLDYPHRLK